LIRYFLRKLFIKDFEVSSIAAALLGPKIASPCCLKISTTPSAKKLSLPTIQRSKPFSFA